MQYKIYQARALASSFLIHFTFSAILSSGTVTPYLASYLYYSGNPSIQVVDLSIIYPLMLTFQNIGLIACSLKLYQILSMKASYLVGVLVFVLSMCITSFMKTYWGYLLFYGVLCGFSIGIPYLNAFKNAYDFFPTRKGTKQYITGMCGGVCMSAYGLGPLLWNQIFLELVNPNNQPVDSRHFFPEDVANNVPGALRIMSVIYLAVGLFATAILIPKGTFHPKVDTLTKRISQSQSMQRPSLLTESSQSQQQPQLKSNSSSYEQMSLTYYFKTSTFWKLFSLAFFMMPFGMFLATNYKQYGEIIVNDDSILTFFGSVGAVCNTLGRLGWNFSFDYLSFKMLTIIINSVLLLSCLSLLIVPNEILYIIILFAVHLTFGSPFGLFPTQTVRIFGQSQGSRLYPFIFVGFSLASLTQFFLHLWLVRQYKDQGFMYCFILYAVLQVIGLGLAARLKFQYKKQEQKLVIGGQIDHTSKGINSD